jgi:hypothetical protein
VEPESASWALGGLAFFFLGAISGRGGCCVLMRSGVYGWMERLDARVREEETGACLIEETEGVGGRGQEIGQWDVKPGFWQNNLVNGYMNRSKMCSPADSGREGARGLGVRGEENSGLCFRWA